MFIRTYGYAPIGGSVDEVIVESGCNNVREDGREAPCTSDEMWIGGQRKHMNMHEGRCEMPEQDGVAAASAYRSGGSSVSRRRTGASLDIRLGLIVASASGSLSSDDDGAIRFR